MDGRSSSSWALGAGAEGSGGALATGLATGAALFDTAGDFGAGAGVGLGGACDREKQLITRFPPQVCARAART